MAVVNQMEKKTMLTRWEIVKYQLITHCYLFKIAVSESDLDCLTLLALEGETELTSFCNKAFEKKIFSSIQSVRNCLSKVEKKNLIMKEGKNKKKIYVHPSLKVLAAGNILVNYKFLSVEAN